MSRSDNPKREGTGKPDFYQMLKTSPSEVPELVLPRILGYVKTESWGLVRAVKVSFFMLLDHTFSVADDGEKASQPNHSSHNPFALMLAA